MIIVNFRLSCYYIKLTVFLNNKSEKKMKLMSLRATSEKLNA